MPPSFTQQSQTSEMEVATPTNEKDIINLSTPKKDRTKKASGNPSPDQVDKTPKTPSTEIKQVYRMSLVASPRTCGKNATPDDLCEDVKKKLHGCPTIHDKMRGPPLELKMHGMQKITVDSKDESEFKTAAKEAGLVLLTEGLNETKLMVITPKDANVAVLVGAWVALVDIWQDKQSQLNQMMEVEATAELAKAYIHRFKGDADKYRRVTYERSTDRLKDAIKECKDGMAIGFDSKEAMQEVLFVLRELWRVIPVNDDERQFIESSLKQMEAIGITGPGKDDGWIVYYNGTNIDITASGMTALGGTKWGNKGEFISTEDLTVNIEAFISPTKGVHAIKSGFREGAPGFEAVCSEMGDGIITVFPRTDEHTESQYIIKLIIKLQLIKQVGMAAKLAKLCNDPRNDSKASRGITTSTSSGDVTLIWSGDLSKARERNGLHPVAATATEGILDTKELEKKNEELVKTVKTLETRLSATDNFVKMAAQTQKAQADEQAKALIELTKAAHINEDKSQKKIDQLQRTLAEQQAEFSAQQAQLQKSQLESQRLNEEFKRQINQMMKGMNKAIKYQSERQQKHEQKFIAIKEIIPFADPDAHAAGDKRRKAGSPSGKEKSLEDVSSEEDSEESGEESAEEGNSLEGEQVQNTEGASGSQDME